MVEIALQKARCVCFLYTSVGGFVSCPQLLKVHAVFSVKKKKFWITPIEEFFPSMKFFQFSLQKVLSKSLFSKVLKPLLLQNLILCQVRDIR